MKMRGKILSVIVFPILVLSIIMCLVSYYEMHQIALKETETGLKTAAVLAKEAYELEIDGEYTQKEDGTYWKGDKLNISENTMVVDKISQDEKMEASFIFGKVRAMTSIEDDNGNRIIGTEIDDEVYQKLQKGESVFCKNIEIQGSKYEAYYLPVYQENSDQEVIGSVFVAKASKELDNGVRHAMTLLIVIMGITICCSILAGWIIVKRIISVLHKGMSMVDHVSAGNLVEQLEQKYLTRRDEAGQISRAINQLREKLQKIFGNIFQHSSELMQTSQTLSRTSKQTLTTIEQVEKAVQDIAQSATSQAEETQRASNHVAVMGDKITETSREVEILNRNAMDMKKSGDEAVTTMEELSSINQKAKEAIEVIYAQTNTTNDSAIKIKEATNLITSIAEETDMLSLNATIEAARAGEQGKGFAVVASQIQKLAEQSNVSAQRIETIILSLLRDSDNAVKTMDEVKEIMENQNENLRKTTDKFMQVKEGIEQSIRGIGTISEKTSDIEQLKEDVVNIVHDLSAIAQENAASAEETSAATTEVAAAVGTVSGTAERLETISRELEESINTFHI